MSEKQRYNLKRIWSINIIGSGGFFLWGYVNSINNSVLPFLGDYVFPDKSDSELSLIASIMILGAAFGAFFSGFLANKFGRKTTMLYGDIICVIAVILTIIENYPVIIVGRLLVGLVVGLNSTVGPLYLIEMAPKDLRGPAGTFNFFVLNIAIVVAYGLGFIVPTTLDPGDSNDAWRVCYGLAGVIPLLRIIFFVFIFKEETPFYLITCEKVEDAEKVL